MACGEHKYRKIYTERNALYEKKSQRISTEFNGIPLLDT